MILTFSFLTSKLENKQISCGMTYTNDEVHKIISDNINRSTMYSGTLKGLDQDIVHPLKIRLLSLKKNKNIDVLEPEGLKDNTVYRGISTSLPEEVQLEILSKIKGLGTVKMKRAGYAIEYDYVILES